MHANHSIRVSFSQRQIQAQLDHAVRTLAQLSWPESGAPGAVDLYELRAKLEAAVVREARRRQRRALAPTLERREDSPQELAAGRASLLRTMQQVRTVKSNGANGEARAVS